MDGSPCVLLGNFHFMSSYAWAYDNKDLARKAANAAQQKPKKKVQPIPKQTLKQRKLIWFISGHGKSVEPSHMENEIRRILNGYTVEYHTEVSFKGLNPKGKHNTFLRFDFYLPTIKTAIEYNGEGYHDAKDVKERDELKRKFCRVNGIKLVTFNRHSIPYLEKKINEIVTGKK